MANLVHRKFLMGSLYYCYHEEDHQELLAVQQMWVQLKEMTAYEAIVKERRWL